jgi:hypothetical protein
MTSPSQISEIKHVEGLIIHADRMKNTRWSTDTSWRMSEIQWNPI